MKDQLTNALKVLTLTPHIRKYLAEHDPKALEQAESAVKLADANIVVLLTHQEAHVTLRALAAANSEGDAPDREPITWVANRILGQLEPIKVEFKR